MTHHYEGTSLTKPKPSVTSAAAVRVLPNPALAVSVVSGDSVALLARRAPLVDCAAAVLAARYPTGTQVGG